ncbi:MAG: hypothetical protein JXR37_13315 [Kiritimatiellae bacterium]|nr:hypothetical protein [Kiritimatiellia bacterium]
MERLIEGPFADCLARNRARFNARVALARHLHRDFEPDAFRAHLQDAAEPVVRAVAEACPGAADAAAEAAFAVSLRLFGCGHIVRGPSFPLIQAAWRTLLTQVPHLLTAGPGTLLAGVSNAICNLASAPGANAELWLADMRRAAPLCGCADELIDAGKVLAWRRGMAHYRAGALAVWRRLPERLARVTLGLEPDAGPSPRALRRLLADPWRRPGTGEREGAGTLALVAQLGGFRGFGGPFICPPKVGLQEGALLAFDAESCWTVHADCFGATLQRHAGSSPKRESGVVRDWRLSAGGEVSRGLLKERFALLQGASSTAATAHTLAVTVPQSHKVFLVAEVAGNGRDSS